MAEAQLFIDGSVNTKLNIGVGAFLLVENPKSQINTLAQSVQLKRFENTSSTKLEIQTLIWALETITFDKRLTIYTDSQNIIGLPNRRIRLETNNFYTKKGQLLKHHELYSTFYKLSDQLNFNLVKLKGHLPSTEKKPINAIFALVDRASRRALRSLN